MAQSRFVLLVIAAIGLIGLRSLFSATPATPVVPTVPTLAPTARTEKKADLVREMQAAAMTAKRADWGYWGPSPEKFDGTQVHSNRLIPVYIFGMNLSSV